MARTVALLGLQPDLDMLVIVQACEAAGVPGSPVYSDTGAVTDFAGHGWRLNLATGSVTVETPPTPPDFTARLTAVVLMFLRYHDLDANEERDGRILAAAHIAGLDAGRSPRRHPRRVRRVILARQRGAV